MVIFVREHLKRVTFQDMIEVTAKDLQLGLHQGIVFINKMVVFFVWSFFCRCFCVVSFFCCVCVLCLFLWVNVFECLT